MTKCLYNFKALYLALFYIRRQLRKLEALRCEIACQELVSATEDQKPGLLTGRSESFPVFHSDGPLWPNGVYLKIVSSKGGSNVWPCDRGRSGAH